MTDKTGYLLCLFSIICMFIAPIVSFFIACMFMNGDISGAVTGAYAYMLVSDIVTYLAAWALAIIARIKYKSTFGLALIIIYAGLLALTIVGAIVLLCVFVGVI